MSTKRPWICRNGSVYKLDNSRENDILIAHMDRESGNGTSPVERDENAALIVRAVNSHEGMLEALQSIAAAEAHRSHPGTYERLYVQAMADVHAAIDVR